jgi:Ribbon-helix-helix protein, copG family
VRTTITIDDDLYRQITSAAARSGRTVGSLIEDAVRDALAARDRPPGTLAPLPTFGGSGTLPGVDLGDSAALRELMDPGAGLDALR